MDNMKNKKLISNITIWAGILTVLGTHILLIKEGLPASINSFHAYVNIASAILIGAGSIIKGMK